MNYFTFVRLKPVLFEEKEEGTDGSAGAAGADDKEESSEEESEEEDKEESSDDKKEEDDLPEEETKEAKALFKLLKDPSTQKETLRVLAAKAGVLDQQSS